MRSRGSVVCGSVEVFVHFDGLFFLFFSCFDRNLASRLPIHARLHPFCQDGKNRPTLPQQQARNQEKKKLRTIRIQWCDWVSDVVGWRWCWGRVFFSIVEVYHGEGAKRDVLIKDLRVPREARHTRPRRDRGVSCLVPFAFVKARG